MKKKSICPSRGGSRWWHPVLRRHSEDHFISTSESSGAAGVRVSCFRHRTQDTTEDVLSSWSDEDTTEDFPPAAFVNPNPPAVIAVLLVLLSLLLLYPDRRRTTGTAHHRCNVLLVHGTNRVVCVGVGVAGCGTRVSLLGGRCFLLAGRSKMLSRSFVVWSCLFLTSFCRATVSVSAFWFWVSHFLVLLCARVILQCERTIMIHFIVECGWRSCGFGEEAVQFRYLMTPALPE